MEVADLREQLLIGDRTPTRTAFDPRVVATGGDVQDAAQGGNGMRGLMRLHEFEDPGGIEPVSRANQAAAFFKISRSSRSVAFSRRRRCNSPFSSVVSPSRRWPLSRSACRTQLRIDCPVTSNSLASACGDRPARTNSTRRWRYSGGYGRRDFGIVHSYDPSQKGVSPRNRGNSRNRK